MTAEANPPRRGRVIYPRSADAEKVLKAFLAAQRVHARAGAHILDTLAWAYLRDNQFEKALETFVEVFRRDPGQGSSWDGVSELVKLGVEGKDFLAFVRDMEQIVSEDGAAAARLGAVREQHARRAAGTGE